MKGKPKVGEVWVVRRTADTVVTARTERWMYRIIAVIDIEQLGRRYIGIKIHAEYRREAPWGLEVEGYYLASFDGDGMSWHTWGEYEGEFRLASRSRGNLSIWPCPTNMVKVVREDA